MNKNELDILLQGIQTQQPRLYDLLRGIIDQVGDLTDKIEPLIRQSTSTASATLNLLPPINFTYSTTDRNLVLSWDQADSAALYEIRKGLLWETADFVVRTPSLSATLDAVLTGSHTYLIKSIDNTFAYSVTSNSVLVSIAGVGLPSLTFKTIDNNVLLFWTEPSAPWEVSYYEVRKDGTLIGTADATFFSIFELQGGNYTYSVTAFDIAGNFGPAASVPVLVNPPPDYELQSIFTSKLFGTRVNLVPVIVAN